MQKNFVIIGASSGIGLALAQSLDQAGHRVFGTYHNQPRSHDTIFYQHFDAEINNQIEIEAEAIDGVAYCPGTIVLQPFSKLSMEQMIQDYKIQVIGAVHVIKQLMPKLKKAQSASIVLFSTVAADIGIPYHTLVASSKGAVQGLARSLAAEFAPKIRVNCIAPSITSTPLASVLLSTQDKIDASASRHPLKRIGNAIDIANAAKYLLTDDSSWMTGQVLHIDGGLSTLKI